MKKSLSLKKKIIALSLLLLSLSPVIGGVSYMFLKEVNSELNIITADLVPKLRSNYEMMLSYRRVRITLRTLGLANLNPTQAKETVDSVVEAIEEYEKHDKEYNANNLSNEEKEAYAHVNTAWLDFKATGVKALELYKTNTPDSLAQLNHIYLKECPEKAKTFTAAMVTLIGLTNKKVTQASVSADEITKKTNLVILSTLAFGFVFGLIVAVVLTTKIVNLVSSATKEIADGAYQVNQASGQIAQTSQSLSQSATEQASSLEETVATMEEITSMVKLNSENGKQAATLAASTRDIAIKGESEIKTLIETIYSISADSKKIEEITNVIDDIAFQTNLLALNAAVEAARAGEQGKGFAVVAEAVRALAQRSSSAAKDIAGLIKNSVEKIEVSSKQASQGGQVLTDIVLSVKKVADLNNEIASASEEQSNGIAQIAKAMNQLDQTTQQNAASSEEAAAAAEELSAQSDLLKKNLSTLEVAILGEESDKTNISSAA